MTKIAIFVLVLAMLLSGVGAEPFDANAAGLRIDDNG